MNEYIGHRVYVYIGLAGDNQTYMTGEIIDVSRTRFQVRFDDDYDHVEWVDPEYIVTECQVIKLMI